MNKYRKEDLEVHTYGNGRGKKFIIYTDFIRDETGARWHTQVYPDIEGNTGKAIKQALNWLNNDGIKKDFAIVKNNPSKVSIVYHGPEYYSETDNHGYCIRTDELLY